jgi:hypothetical protein
MVLLGFALVAVAMLLPGTAGARTITTQTELGELMVKPDEFSLKLNGSATDPMRTAHAAGSSIGRIPRCPDRGRRATRKKRPPFGCVLKQFAAALVVVDTFLFEASSGAGDVACPLVTEAERIRLGGVACPQRVRAEAEGLAAREPTLSQVGFRTLRPGAHGEAVLILHHPRDAVLLELLVVPHRYWRLSDVGDLFP